MAYNLTPGDSPRAVSGDVHFSLTIDGVVQRYIVSREALADHFDPVHRDAREPMEAFKFGEVRILQIAARKLGSAPIHGNGGAIVVGTFDFL